MGSDGARIRDHGGRIEGQTDKDEWRARWNKLDDHADGVRTYIQIEKG